MNVLRHLLAIAVIFQHMEGPSRCPAFLNFYILNSAKLVDRAVAGFFLISGLFARPDRALPNFPRQTRRLLAPYLLFSVLYAAVLIVLHKTTLRESVLMTITGLGVGAQLYFLPYLLLVSTAMGAVLALGRKGVAAALMAVLFVAYLMLSTAVSTGSEPRLLALDALTFTFGYYRATFTTSVEVAALAVLALATVVLVPWHSRYFDLGLIIVLVEIVLQLSRRVPLRRRFSGSGGVYLLHAPRVELRGVHGADERGCDPFREPVLVDRDHLRRRSGDHFAGAENRARLSELASGITTMALAAIDGGSHRGASLERQSLRSAATLAISPFLSHGATIAKASARHETERSPRQ